MNVQTAFTPFIVGVGGTARPNSTSEQAARVALDEAARLGAKTRLFDGNFISSLPLYDPSVEARNANQVDFVDAVRTCDGIIVSSPGYHGSISGPIKNILDLLEDTRSAERPYLDGRAFGCIVTAHGWQAGGTGLVSMRLVAHALRAWPTPFGAVFNASSPMFNADGSCVDKRTQHHLQIVASQVVEFALQRSQCQRI